MKLKLIVAALVLGSAVTYLAYAGVRKGWVYYVQVDQFAGDATYATQRVRLCGKVSPEGFAVLTGRRSAKFTLLGETKSVPVLFRGTIPDMFEPSCEAVVEGKLDAAGVFQADSLMTKCASKYEGGKMVPAPEKAQ